MHAKQRHRLYQNVLDDVWDGSSRVSYNEFVQGLQVRLKAMRSRCRDDVAIPSSATYTRIWQDFCDRHGLRSANERQLKRVLRQGIAEGIWDADADVREVLPIAKSYLVRQMMVPPGPTVLLRLLRTARHRSRKGRQRTRERLLAEAFGNAVSSLPMTRKYRIAQHILRYPSVLKGRAGLHKLEDEDRCRKEIEATLEANKLSVERLLATPGSAEAFEFVDRQASSTLRRWQRNEVVQRLPLYLAIRYQQAVDVVLFVFVRLARLLRFRVKARFDDQLHDTSRALFERHGGEFAALRRTVLDTLEGADPRALHSFRPLLRDLEEQGEAMSSEDGYYQLLASRGTFARKLARRLEGIPLEGRDPHASAIVSALEEVFRFLPFAERVPTAIRRRLSFLDVPQRRLANRRVFETVVLITLADLL